MKKHKNDRKILNRKNKIVKSLNKVKKFCQQIRQGPYFICIVSHWCLLSTMSDYFNMRNQIFTAELYCPERSLT